jgi:hypothetical protein
MTDIRGYWQKIIWKLVTNPGIELVATIAIVMVATWYLVETQTQMPEKGVPILFGRH